MLKTSQANRVSTQVSFNSRDEDLISESASLVTLLSSESRVYLLNDGDLVGLFERRSV